MLFLISFALVPLSFLAGVLRSRFDRASAARILLSLDAGVPLRDAVADALHDPSLEIVYRLGDREGWVDADGRDVEEPTATPERAVTTIERGGRRVAALVHDPSLAEEPDTIDLVASAVGLPLENVRLQAELRSQFSFLVTLVNTAPSLFIHLDTEGTIVNQNVAAVEAAGEDERGGDPRPQVLGRLHRRVGARRRDRALRGSRARPPCRRVREHLRQPRAARTASCSGARLRSRTSTAGPGGSSPAASTSRRATRRLRPASASASS